MNLSCGYCITKSILWLEFSATQPKYRHGVIPETRLLAVMDADVQPLTESELYVQKKERNMSQFYISGTDKKKRCFRSGAPVGQIGGTVAQILQGFFRFKIKMWSMWGVCLISQIYWLWGEETSFTLFCFTVKPFIWSNCSVFNVSDGIQQQVWSTQGRWTLREENLNITTMNRNLK